MRTIVGGRPRKGDGRGRDLRRGIEVLLLKANVDADFRDLLGRDWRAAATSIELELSESETAILDSVPGRVLVEMSSRMRVRKADRPIFLGKTAAAMLALLAGVSVASCTPSTPPPVGGQGKNEPPAWGSPLIIRCGIEPQTDFLNREFESEDAVEEPGDAEPAAVNEPYHFSPDMPIFGVAPEWNERRLEFESEDDPEPKEG